MPGERPRIGPAEESTTLSDREVRSFDTIAGEVFSDEKDARTLVIRALDAFYHAQQLRNSDVAKYIGGKLADTELIESNNYWAATVRKVAAQAISSASDNVHERLEIIADLFHSGIANQQDTFLDNDIDRGTYNADNLREMLEVEYEFNREGFTIAVADLFRSDFMNDLYILFGDDHFRSSSG